MRPTPHAAFLLIFFAICLASLPNESDANEGEDGFWHSVSVGLRYTFAERVLKSDDFESDCLLSQPVATAAYHFNEFTAQYVSIGIGQFSTDDTRVDHGLVAGLLFTSDFYEFESFYAALRVKASVDYFRGDGETGPSDISTGIEFLDWKISLAAVSYLDRFTLYGGPVVSILRGRSDPEGFSTFSFQERQILGLYGGADLTFQGFEGWSASAEIHYADYFYATFTLQYRF